MTDARRADVAGRVFVTLGALLPYWRFLTFSVVYVTDDWFASDIFNGFYLPLRGFGRMDRPGPKIATCWRVR